MKIGFLCFVFLALLTLGLRSCVGKIGQFLTASFDVRITLNLLLNGQEVALTHVVNCVPQMGYRGELIPTGTYIYFAEDSESYGHRLEDGSALIVATPPVCSLRTAKRDGAYFYRQLDPDYMPFMAWVRDARKPVELQVFLSRSYLHRSDSRLTFRSIDVDFHVDKRNVRNSDNEFNWMHYPPDRGSEIDVGHYRSMLMVCLARNGLDAEHSETIRPIYRLDGDARSSAITAFRDLETHTHNRTLSMTRGDWSESLFTQQSPVRGDLMLFAPRGGLPLDTEAAANGGPEGSKRNVAWANFDDVIPLRLVNDHWIPDFSQSGTLFFYFYPNEQRRNGKFGLHPVVIGNEEFAQNSQIELIADAAKNRICLIKPMGMRVIWDSSMGREGKGEPTEIWPPCNPSALTHGQCYE